MDKKTCSTCKNALELSRFHKSSNRCKDCTRVYAQDYYNKNKDKVNSRSSNRYRENSDPNTNSNLGYLYILEYSTGVIKVGRSLAKMGRIRYHSEYAKSLDVDVLNTWVSEPVDNLLKKENDLVLWCINNASQRLSAETFKGFHFDQVKDAADQIIKE